jgi:hypothetical protein
MDWSYYDTFITASEDSPARSGAVPPDREGRPTRGVRPSSMRLTHR